MEYNLKAKIFVTEKEVIWGRKEVYFDWVGPRSGLAEINITKYERYYKNMPFKLKIIDKWALFNKCAYVVALVEKQYWFSAIFHVISAAVYHFKVFIKTRMILTAMIWGIAYVPDYEIPSWKHMFKKRR